MASSELEKIINDFCSLYGMKLNKLSFLMDKVPAAQINGKGEVQGLRNLVSLVSNPSIPELEVTQDQWVEYILTCIGNLDGLARIQILKDINDHLEDKVYFVGHQLGPVDILFYYLIYSVMANLTFQEKEKYLNFSRWFNNIQQNENARSGRQLIPFSRSCLYV